jgi:hypothetical protein
MSVCILYNFCLQSQNNSIFMHICLLSHRDKRDQPTDALHSEQLLAMLYCMAILRLEYFFHLIHLLFIIFVCRVYDMIVLHILLFCTFSIRNCIVYLGKQ